MPISK